MRLMYDSVNPDAIPRNAPMVAGYIDGTDYRWPESAWERFPNSTKVRIARRVTTNDGHVLDVEFGIPTVWPPTNKIVSWVQMRRQSGIEPTIYCNQLNDWPGIRTLFHNAGVREPNYWVARYNNVRDIPVGAVAKQFANPPLAGGHYDLSIVADYWPGVDEETAEVPDMNDTEHAWLEELVQRLRQVHLNGGQVLNFDAPHWAAGGDYTKMWQSLDLTLISDLRARLDLIMGAVSDDEANILAAIRQAPENQAQAIADALGPDLGQAVVDVLKDRL